MEDFDEPTSRTCSDCGYVAYRYAMASAGEVLHRHGEWKHPDKRRARAERSREQLLAALEYEDYNVPCISDPEVWFPVKGGDASTPKRLCDACPVKTE